MKKIVDLEKLAKLLDVNLSDLKKVLKNNTTSSSDEVCEHTQ